MEKMAKKNKITTASILKAIKTSEADDKVTITFGEGENTVEIAVKKYLTLTERASMVNDVLSMVFVTDETGTRYYSAFEKFAIDYQMVTYFTDIPMPDDVDKASEFIDKSNIVAKIFHALSDGYAQEVICEISRAIEYRKNEIVKKGKLDDILTQISDLMKAVTNKLGEMDAEQIMGYLEGIFPDLKEQLSEVVPPSAKMPHKA